MASEHDQRFAEPQRDGDQDAHRDHGDQHVEQQFVGFLGGGLAVVARDVSSTSAGITLPFSGSTRRSTLSATSMAFVPLRLAIAMRHGRVEDSCDAA